MTKRQPRVLLLLTLQLVQYEVPSLLGYKLLPLALAHMLSHLYPLRLGVVHFHITPKPQNPKTPKPRAHRDISRNTIINLVLILLILMNTKEHMSSKRHLFNLLPVDNALFAPQLESQLMQIWSLEPHEARILNIKYEKLQTT